MELGKLVAVFDADTRRFDAGLRGVQTKIGLVTKDLGRATASTGQLTAATGSASSGLGVMGGALGLTAGAAIGAAAAISATAAGVYKLATFSQQLGGEIHDLSQKVNFSAETLSSLKVAAELSGGSLASLSTSLGIFDRNLEEAGDKTSEMSRIFRVLNIDAKDNEKALRQAFVQLGNITSGSLQTATAMKLFGRSGKEVLGIIKESGGDVDKYIERLREMGIVITKDGAEKADKFGDELTLLQNKLEAIARQIGQELVPTVSKAADDISRWLKQNQGEIIKTAKELGTLVSWVYTLGKAIAANSPYVIAINVVRTFRDISAGSAQGAAEATARQGGSINAAGLRLPTGVPILPIFRTPGRGVFDSPFRLNPEQQAAAIARRAQEALEARLRGASAGGGRGGGGGGGSARTDPAVSFLKQLEDQFRSLTPQTELQKVQQKLLNDEYAKSSDAIKKKIMITAIEIDQQTKILALTRERIAVSRLRRVTDPGLESSVRDRIFDPVTWGAGQRLRRVGEPDTTMDATRPRVATVELQVMRERLQIINDEMQGLASNLTQTFDRALFDGIYGGGLRGLESLSMGFLDMIQQVILGKLKTALAEALTAGASGSGWIAKLLGFFIGAAAGGVSGGIGGGVGGNSGPVGSGIGNFAKGGFVPGVDRGFDSVPAMLRPGELVLNKRQQGMLGPQVVNNYTINLPPSPKGGYTSPKSQRELGDKLLAMLQGSQA